MSRISTLAANTLLLNQTLQTQKRILDGQVSVSSEKKSQDYQGIYTDSRRLVNMENSNNLLSRFVENNEQEDVVLKASTTVLESIETTLNDFRSSLSTYAASESKDAAQVKSIQDQAFQALLSLQDYLNTDVDGRYLYSGGKTSSEAVTLGLSTVSDFQTKYDGERTTYALTRDAHLDTFSLSQDTLNTNKKHVTNTNFLQFRRDGDNDPTTSGTSSITASSALFSHVSAGSYYTVTNSGSNNGSYVVDSVSSDGRTINVKSKMFTDESTVTGATITYADPTDDAKTLTLSSADFTSLSFTRDNDTMVSASATGLTALQVGEYFTVSGTAQNDGTYTIASKTGNNTVTIESVKLTDEGIDRASSGGTANLDLYTNTDVEFNATNSTIQIRQSGQATGVENIFSSLVAGNTFTVAGSTSNNGLFTVSSVSADGSTVTVAEAITNETDTDGTSFTGNVTYTSGTRAVVTNVGGAGTDTVQIQDGAGGVISGALGSLTIGDKVSLSGSATSDNANYTVTAVNAATSTFTVAEDIAATENNTTGVHLEANSGNSTFFKMITNTDIEFTAGTNVIQVRESGTTTAVPNIFTGLKVGNTFAVTNSTSNNATFTITAIGADGSSVTVAEALTAETDTTGVDFAGVGDVALAYSSGTRVTFTNVGAAGTDTIQVLDSAGAALTGAFNDLTVGQTFSMSGAGPGYDNSNYTITAKSTDGSTVTVAEDITGVTATDTDGVKIEAFAVDGKLEASSYYNGDSLTQTHRVDSDRSFINSLNAIDPAFEKAIRAMGIILQGKYGTAGGLDQNSERADQALYLIDSAQERTVAAAPPAGLSTELTSNLEEIQITMGFNRVLIKNSNALHTNLIGFYEANISDMENSDPLETITKLLDDQRVLEASFQTYARIRQLSLTNFI
jgi:hypothetical protein